VEQQRRLREGLQELSRQQCLGDSRSQEARSDEAAELCRLQSDIKTTMNELSKILRDIATSAGDEEGRALEQSLDFSRSLRPIEEKMDTSNMILQRGMVNLSLKLETDIETELRNLQQQVRGLGTSQPDPNSNAEDVGRSVAELRESLERLQEQLQQTQQQSQQPDSSGIRQGERSGAFDQQNPGQVSRNELQESLNESRELARGLEQMGRGAGGAWTGSARSIRSQLTQQGLDEFLSRPELLQSMLQPLIELEKNLRVRAELNEIDSKLYSVLDEDVPDAYKTKVENYYRVLSESKNANQ